MDINEGAVFDDILIEFEQVLKRGLINEGYNINLVN